MNVVIIVFSDILPGMSFALLEVDFWILRLEIHSEKGLFVMLYI